MPSVFIREKNMWGELYLNKAIFEKKLMVGFTNVKVTGDLDKSSFGLVVGTKA